MRQHHISRSVHWTRLMATKDKIINRKEDKDLPANRCPAK
jgi:hypothetical protein